MKTKYLFLFFLLCSSTLFCQNLIREKWHYYQNKEPNKSKEVKKLFSNSPQILKNHKKAELQFAISSGLFLMGGAYTGGQIGHLSATKELEWKKASIGVGIIALGFVVSKGVNKKFDAAVRDYNQQITKKSSFKWNPSKQGLGICLSF